MIGSAAKTFRKEQPAVFRQIGKKFFPDRHNVDDCEMTDKIIQQWRSIWGMADLGRHNEGKPSTSPRNRPAVATRKGAQEDARPVKSAPSRAHSSMALARLLPLKR